MHSKAIMATPIFPSYRELFQIMTRGTLKYTNGPYCQILYFFMPFERQSYIDTNVLFFFSNDNRPFGYFCSKLLNARLF